MHEVGIMAEVLRIAGEHARRAGADRIERIDMRVGALSGVVPDALTFAFEALSQGTQAEGGALSIETVPVTARCGACDEEFSPPDVFYECPRCGQPSADIRTGREIEVAALQVSTAAIHGGPPS